MKKSVALVLVIVLLNCFLVAVGENAAVRLTFFPQNSMGGHGVLTGGVGQLFASEGLIIDVVPHSTERLQSMLASGDLCDIMWLPEQEMKAAMKAGYLLDLTPYLDHMPHVQANSELFIPSINFAREYNSESTGKLFYLAPVGDPAAVVAADTDRFAIKMNWELYAKSGHPSFSTLEESISVFKQMQKDTPVTEEGLPTYAIHMFSDFDNEYFYNMNSIYTILGKDYTYLPYGIEWDFRTHKGVSIFSEGSTYYRGLKFFYEMNKAGLVDPDSLAQTRATAKAKIDAGAALAGWAANPGWEAWGGYYPVVFEEFVPSYQAVSPYGTAGYCISADCKDPEAAVRFLDMLANEDVLLTLRNGPQGYNWDIDENGKPYLTEFYFAHQGSREDLVDNRGNVWTFWNIAYLYNQGYITRYGVPYVGANWPDMYDRTYSSELAQDWTELYGYTYLNEMLNALNWETAVETKGYAAFLSADDEQMKSAKAALKSVIVPCSWQMVFASSDAEFNAIWEDMKARCERLQIDEVIRWKLDDIANATQIYDNLAE